MFLLQASSYHRPVRLVRGPMQVFATFERSWHLRTGDGQVLTVTSLPHDGPMTVRVNRPHLSGLGVRPGMAASIEGDTLSAGQLRVDLRHATPWSPDAVPLLPLDRPALSSDLASLRQAVPYLAHHRGDALWLRALDSNLMRLRRALAAGDATAAQQAARSLLGLGPGLTPTGDDVLCGLLATFSVFRRRTEVSIPSIFPSRTSEDSRLATTPLSHTLLTWAARGVATQPLLDVLWSLGSGGAIRGVDETVALGHSSGRDILTGVELAISVLCEREEMGGPALAGQIERVP